MPFKVWKKELSSTFCLSLPSKDDVENLFKWPFVLSAVPMKQGKRKLSVTVLVHCTDVRVLLERLCGETKLEFGIVCWGKGFPKCSLILFVNVNHTLHHMSHRPKSFGMEVEDRPFRYLSAWLPNHTIIFRRFGPLLSSKSCLHSYVWLIWKSSA